MPATFYPPGQTPTAWRPGDFLLCTNPHPWHTKAGVVSALIRFGQRLRFRGPRRVYARWNHAVGIADGHLVEALGHGVVRSSFEAYTPVEYWYVTTDLTDSQRADCAAYWDNQIGDPYGYLTIASIAVQLVTGLHIGISRTGHVICSGLVCAGLGLWQWRSNPSFVKPADLAEHHEVHP